MYRKIAKQLAQTTTDILETIDFEEDKIMAEVNTLMATSLEAENNYLKKRNKKNGVE